MLIHPLAQQGKKGLHRFRCGASLQLRRQSPYFKHQMVVLGLVLPVLGVVTFDHVSLFCVKVHHNIVAQVLQLLGGCLDAVIPATLDPQNKIV